MTLSSSFSFSCSSSSLTSLEPSTPPPKKTTTGFRELAKSDARFEPYARTLFARPTSANDPDALEGPLARRLDASLAAFARLVGPRLPEPAAARALVRLIAPMVPHLAEEAWARLGEPGLVADAAWPAHDPALLVDDEVTIAVQVNGKLRDTLTAPKGMAKDALEAMALQSDKISKLLDGATPRKVIVVPDRLVNIVA